MRSRPYQREASWPPGPGRVFLSLFSQPPTPRPNMQNRSYTEGTGTWPDYLVNRVLTKIQRPYLKKNVQKSRNSCRKNSGGEGEHGQVTRSSNRVSPETNTNAQRILLKSRLLRSAWHSLAPNCWSFPHCFPVPSLEACLQIVTFFQ